MAEPVTRGGRRRWVLTLHVDLDLDAVVAKLRGRLAKTKRPRLKLFGTGGRLQIRFDRARAPFTDYEVRPTVVRLQLTEHPTSTTVVATAGRRLDAAELQRFLNLTAVQGATNLFADLLDVRAARDRRRREATKILDHVAAALGPHTIAAGQSAYRNPAREQ